MASICKEIVIDAPADHVWDAIRDVGAIHTRLAQGHRSRVVWIADLLPDDLPGPIGGMTEQAAPR